MPYVLSKRVITVIKANSELESPLELMDDFEGPMSTEVAEQLADALSNAKVTELSLDMDLSSIETLYPLAEALKRNTSLHTVSLNNCEITTAGALVLAEALKSATLTSLNIIGNAINQEIAALIFDKFNVEGQAPRVSYRLSQPEKVVPLAPDLTDKEKAILYVANYVLPVLSKEKSRLDKKYGPFHLRVMILDGMLNAMTRHTDHFEKDTQQTAAEFKTQLENDIKTGLSQKGLDKYPSWVKKLSLILLNVLMFLPVVTMAVKRVATGSWFFSLEGKSQEAAKESLNAVNKMDISV